MVRGLSVHIASGVLMAACVVAPAAQAQDFFSALFGGLAGRPPGPTAVALPYANEGAPPEASPRAYAPRVHVARAGQAWCVRTCDGRYFPITGQDSESRAASCNSFCPASKTEIVYGEDIDNAATSSGKSYSELPNAFRYRNEIVAGCTCNGKDQIGLAPVSIENDPTLRKGDIIAGANGLVVANESSGRHTAMNFSPISPAMRARFQHVPIVAQE
jgi:hypothetical protein